MEAAVVLVVGTLLLLAAVSPILALVALLRTSRLERRLGELALRLERTEREAPAPAEAAATARSEPRPPAARAPGIPEAAEPPAATPGSTPPPAAIRPPPGPSPRSSQPGPDFATHLGPRLLVAAGGLAVVVFLGLFVRYAWENEWVGPTGRVLTGAIFSLGLIAAGLRLLGREYRPLGQGLAAAGFAGLYLSAYAAHGVYSLVPRAAAAALMAFVVLCAVIVADRLGTRLLAALAWAGGYLAPILLSTGEDRAESLLGWLLLLGGGAILVERRRGWREIVVIAAVGSGVLSLGWSAEHLRPERFGIAAVSVVLLGALFALAPSPRALAPGLALLAGGAASIVLAVVADRPVGLLALLAALAGVAVLARRRWPWSEATSIALGALAVLAWYDRFFRPDRVSETLSLGLTVAGLHVLVLAVRGLVARQEMGLPDTVVQLVSAGLAWVLLDRVLSLTQPSLVGPAALALGALHLALGLAARREGSASLLWATVALALAAVFLTLAIPVQLGLFGATLGWAAEGLVLLWLGTRQGSALVRLGGYGVLLLAVVRLFVRHLPLHAGPFAPVFNPVFGTWLLVIVALGVARGMAPRGRPQGQGMDDAARVVLAALGLALLFGLLTGETQAVFDERARIARGAGDVLAAVAAQRQAGLAQSLLWTVFATSLLAAGLAVRSRALFYAAYGLFGITATRVVLVDLATLPTLYRMLSFLALGVLLLAGAWLNLRFRERLLAPGDAG